MPFACMKRCFADLYVCPADSEIRLVKTQKNGTP